MNKIINLCALLLLVCLPVTYAQGVFVTEGENGPVFSNQQRPGAREVDLRPLSVVPAARQQQRAEQPGRQENTQPQVAPAYRSFAIEFPEQNGAITTGTGIFNVYLASEPALNISQGHAFMISINDKPANVRYTDTRFTIPENFWGDTLPPAGEPMQLEATIVDTNGQILMKAAPVTFVIHYHQGRSPVPPRPMPGRPGGR